MNSDENTPLTNPLSFDSERVGALDWAYDNISEAIDEYATLHELTPEQTLTLHRFVTRVYIERKAAILLEEKTSHFSVYLDKAIHDAFTKPLKEDESVSWAKVLYYNNKKSLVKHEF